MDRTNTKNEVKIPTLLGIILIIIIIGGVGVVTNFFLKGNSIARYNPDPQHVVITTITDSGFTVTWETDTPVFSAVTITDPKGEKQTFFDERHVSGDTNKYSTTSVPVRGLLPDTGYSIELLLDGKPHKPSNISFVRTGPKVATDTNGMAPVYGSVIMDNNKPADGALVFLTLGEDSQLLSTIVKPSGSWIIPLNLLRTEDLSKLIEKSTQRQQISITVRLNGRETTVLTDTFTASPVPTVTIGNTYDFRGQQAKKKTDDKQQELTKSFSSVLGVQSEQTNSVATAVQLVSPPQGSHIPGDPPRFSGRGIPGNFVTLLIGRINPQAETTRVQDDGTWQFSPPKAIGAGQQRVTMTTLDLNKKPVAITHLFEIMKSGTQVLGIATPSATIATTPTRTPTPTTGTITPSPTVIASTPTPTVPTTATTLPTNVLLIAGIGLLLTGLIVIAL